MQKGFTYLGSYIFALLGIETQENFLGIYKDENVVVIQIAVRMDVQEKMVRRYLR